MDKITARWTAGRQFVGSDENGHGIVLDTPPSAGGENTGWRPLELVLLGLAGCSGIDILSILEKKREDVRGFEVEVTGETYTADYPHYYEAIEITYFVTGVGVSEKAVAQAIDLSTQKYCSVKGCLGPQCVVTTKFEISEFAPHVGPNR